MIIIWTILWAFSTACAMYFCEYRHLPAESAADRESTAAGQEESSSGRPKSFITRGIRGKMTLAVCAALAGSAAIFVFTRQSEVTLIAIAKITVAFSVLGIIVITDINEHRIPNYCSVVFLAARAVSFAAELYFYRELAFSGLLSSLLSAVICFLILMFSSLITRGGIGYGDIKFFTALGFLCGIHAAAFTLLFSLLFCAAVSAVLLLTKKKNIRDSIPMGPFILAGFYVVVVLGIG